MLCFKWVCEKLKLGTSWYDNSDVFQGALEKAMLAPEFNKFEESDEDADMETSEMDFEINDDDRVLEHVPSIE